MRRLARSETTQEDATRRRPARQWVMAWLAATMGASALHFHVWNPPLEDGSSLPMFAEELLKISDNVVQLAILPAWVIVWRFLGRFQDLTTTLLANGLGWGMWCVVAAGVVHLLRRSASETDRVEPTSTPGVANPQRRRFLAGAALGTGAGVAAVTGGVGALVTPWRIGVARYTVEIAGLPANLHGLRIVQISDTHLGPRIPREHVMRAIALAQDLRPDLIALTGDYIHMGDWYITPAVAMFRDLVRSRAARLGVVAVLGNHDYYGDAERTLLELEEAGVRVLDNSRCFVAGGREGLLDELAPGEEGLCIGGVGDLLEGTVDVEAALGGVPEHVPRVVLAHNPDTSEHIVERALGGVPRVDLMLSGHTHGGQISIPGYGPPVVPSRFGRRFAYGLVETSLCPMIVTSGVGMSIMPLRVGVPPEVVEVTLHVGKGQQSHRVK